MEAVRRRRDEHGVSSDVPWETGVDYDKVEGRCAENVIGYVPIPVGLAGPLRINGDSRWVPMATVEGCLIASTSRGCKVLRGAEGGGGVRAAVLRQHMTRAPVFRCASLDQAVSLAAYVESDEATTAFSNAVESTSRYARFVKATCFLAGSLAYVRIACHCGDAMGMNMVSKAVEKIVAHLTEERFPSLELVSLSGNLCCDKKSSAVNWIDGRGCHVVAEARLSRDIVESVLKVSPEVLVDTHVSKNLVGSALAGASMGGSNAHAANVVAAVFAATGQDLAQVVGSAACLTHMRMEGKDLLVASCTMPNIEVGVVGGGTHLDAQRACLDMVQPEAASDLALVVCGATLAAELSLLAALASNTLVKDHMRMNRG